MSVWTAAGVMTTAELNEKVGQTFVSDWIAVDQDRINAFAEVTEDRQYIHVDPERAASSPFGGTVAHGFLTLSLLSPLFHSALPKPEGAIDINYGFDRVRFVHPVPSGGRVRAQFLLTSVVKRSERQWLVVYDVSVEIEGVPKPALAATWQIMYLIE
jgi:acyl dehydratase